MNNKSTINKIGLVALSNIVNLASSVLIGFVIPDILGMTSYGYYRMFMLYLTYIGLFHFGFIDGIYLKYGGVEYIDLDKLKFRGYFKFLLGLEFAIACLGIILVQLLMNGDRAYIFTLLFVNLLVINLTTYFQFISQITSRFKEYSTRLIFLSITNILILGVMFILGIRNYSTYLILLVVVNFMLLLWYIVTYRRIVFGIKLPLNTIKDDIFDLYRLGIPLLLANLSTTFVITIDKLFVEYFFTVEEFGVYSFAYSMLVMINAVITAIGVVLYPTLKKVNIESIPNYYPKLIRLVIHIVLLGLIGYFPLMWIVPMVLPNYVESLTIFRIALPGLLFTSTITAIKHNIFKISNRNNHFFLISIFSICINIVLNFLAIYNFGTKESIAASSIIGLGFWYLTTEIYISRNFKVKSILNIVVIVLGLTLFYGLTIIDNYIIGGLLYSASICTLTMMIYKKELSLLYRKHFHRQS